MTNGETVVTSGLPGLEARIQNRGQLFVQVLLEGETPSSSSCESEGEPSLFFFLFITLRSDVVATKPDAAGTEVFKREGSMVSDSFLRRPWSPPTTEPNEGTPGTGQSPACKVPRIHERYIQV